MNIKIFKVIPILVLFVLLDCTILAHEKENLVVIIMQSWKEHKWEKALKLSQGLDNHLFFQLIKSDYLLSNDFKGNYLNAVEQTLTSDPLCLQKILLLQKAEKELYQYPNAQIINWCKKYEPKTIQGKKAYLSAIYSLSSENYANKVNLIRDIWINNLNIDYEEEMQFLDRYKKFIQYDDYVKKIDYLLWHKKHQEASHYFYLLKPQDKFIARCRVLLQQKNHNAIPIYSMLLFKRVINHGLLYDFLLFHSNKRLVLQRYLNYFAPLKFLGQEKEYSDEFSNMRMTYAYGLIQEKAYKEAYNLVVNNNAKEGTDNYIKIHQLAGFIALCKLKNTEIAKKHFLLAKCWVKYPSETAKTFYFLYRCFKSNSRDLSMRYLQIAMRHKSTFYGQIARIEYEELMGIKNMNKKNFMCSTNVENTNVTLHNPYELIPENPYKFYNEIIMISMLVKYEKYKTANILCTKLFGGIKKSQILFVVNILQTVSKNIAWKMMLGNFALNRGVFMTELCFPILCKTKGNYDDLVNAIIRKESSFRSAIKSSANAQGLMQIKQSTVLEYKKRLRLRDNIDIFDQETNIHLGLTHLKLLLKAFNGNIVLTVAGYNAGRSKILKWIKKNGDLYDKKTVFEVVEWIESIPFGETKKYVQNVLANKCVYFSMRNQWKMCIKEDLLSDIKATY